MNVKETLLKGTTPKIFAYGYGKTRKTTWAGQAAATNMNPIYVDCDKSVSVLANTLTPEQQERMKYLDISDNVDTAVAGWFAGCLMRNRPFIWDVEDKRQVKSRVANHDCVIVNPKLFTPNDVLILDSYTQICNSLALQYSKENNIDITDAEKTEWDGYGWMGRLATGFITCLMTLKCTIVVIGHVKTYEKKRKDKFGKEVIVSTRTQPLSVSNPHGETLNKSFSDMLYFYKQGTGTKISTKTSDELDCGSRYVEPKEWAFDDLTFEKIVTAAGVNKANKLKAWIDIPATMSTEEFNKLWTEMCSATNNNNANNSTKETGNSNIIKPAPQFFKK